MVLLVVTTAGVKIHTGGRVPPNMAQKGGPTYTEIMIKLGPPYMMAEEVS